MATNNEYLRNIADGVDPSGATTTRTLNNEYLRRISEGIGNIVVPQTGKVDATRIEGVIPSDNLPSFVDDVIEAYVVGQTAYASDWLSLTANGTALTPESGKIYVVMSGAYADTTYRWGGSSYVPLGSRIEIATQQEAEAGTNDSKMMTPLKTRQAIDANAYSLPTMEAATKATAAANQAASTANDAAENADTKAQLAETATAQANAAAADATLAAAQARGAISANLRFSIDIVEIDGARRLVIVDAGESEE